MNCLYDSKVRLFYSAVHLLEIECLEVLHPDEASLSITRSAAFTRKLLTRLESHPRMTVNSLFSSTFPKHPPRNVDGVLARVFDMSVSTLSRVAAAVNSVAWSKEVIGEFNASATAEVASRRT